MGIEIDLFKGLVLAVTRCTEKCEKILRLIRSLEKRGIKMEKKEQQKEPEFKYDIVKHIGVISDMGKGWKKELNMVSWNGRPEKYDIRNWSSDHKHMDRGITLHQDDMQKLVDLFVTHSKVNTKVPVKKQATE